MGKLNYIANVGDNRQLYKKAYLIEFMDEKGWTAEEAFTFSVPPESEELTYTQRKSETKTFGGLHVDEYGIDAVKIVLSGSTINQELKKIYRGKLSDKWLTGEEEIYYLRDLIKKYRTGVENLKKKIFIYDLSKSTHANEAGNHIKNYWQAFPGDFKIRRSSDRPFTYKYTFEFTGIPIEEGEAFNSHGLPPGPNVEQVNLLTRIMNGLFAAIDFIDGINARVNNFLDKVNQVSKLLKVLGNVMSYATNTLIGTIDSGGDSAAGLVEGVTSIMGGLYTASSLYIPREIQLKAMNAGLELQNATRDLVKSVESFSETCRDTFKSEYQDIPQEVLDQHGMSNEEFKDSVSMMLRQAENTANEMAAAAKSANIPEVAFGNPDPETGIRRMILSYGNTSVMIKETDTLDSLASQYLGSPDRAIDIATYNNIASLGDLKPGAMIKIPITTKTENMKNNLIFSRRDDRDNYGRDILLSDDGLMMTSTSGDYALTSGAKNLSQAILLRLRESVSKRIRLNAYGIRTNISDPTAGAAYIISSIELTVSRDPRVLSVDHIRFSSGGDYLNVSIDYSDINKSSRNSTGSV